MNCGSKTCRYLAKEPFASALNSSLSSAFCNFSVPSLLSVSEMGLVDPRPKEAREERSYTYVRSRECRDLSCRLREQVWTRRSLHRTRAADRSELQLLDLC